MCKKTILFDEHVSHGGKIVEFAGYLLPVEYTGITPEHVAVRENCGLFDVSHMGEIIVTGRDTLKFLDYIITSNISSAGFKRMTYGMMLYEDGGVVDDLMTYKFNDEFCFLVVNASNVDKDYEWLNSHTNGFDVNVENVSSKYSQLALQGPKAVDVLQSLTKYDLSKMVFFDFDNMNVNNRDFIVSRSGYTGSDGFEIYGSGEDIVNLFKVLVDEKNVTLCGLGCRDTLRFEAAMPLYGHEISEKINPVMAGYHYAYDLSKDNFIGKEPIKRDKEFGPKKCVVGLELIERGIARGDYEVYADDRLIGYVTTGYMIPSTNNCYACALIDSEYSKKGTIVEVKIRKNLVKAKVRNKKFLDKKYVR